MVTTVQQSNSTASNLTEKKLLANTKISSSDVANLRLHLTQTLQTTLELPDVLQLFHTALQDQLSIDGLVYSNSKLITNIKLGSDGRHNCSYSLKNELEDLGELKFSRSSRFEEQDLEILENITSCLIHPIRNALLYRDAVQNALRDPLTGAGNRLALENTLDSEIALASRHKRPLSILLIDIDKFKSINDNYGHLAGDFVLKKMVTTLRENSRETDRVYRYGGEEFVLILNNTARNGAMIVAERIRRGVEQSNILFDDQAIDTTISIGLAALFRGDNIASLFARADKALYKAKGNGRNQVIDWQNISAQTTELP